MLTSLLPASAAAFAPRSSPTVVLSRVEPWLTQTLKRVNRVKRPLNNVNQHTRCLTETLSSPNAIWTLSSVMLPKAPESELQNDENPLVDALFNYELVHMEAYVVHVDMVSRNEIAFKLTPETIETLVDHHKEVYSVDTAASTWEWTEKEIQLKKLQEEFVQAANRFVYRTSALALDGMEEEGAGELLCGRAEEAKAAIMSLFVPLLPPPPRVVDVVRHTPLLPSSTGPEEWWHSPVQHTSPSVDSWNIVQSSPTPPPTTNECHQNLWATIMTMSEMHLPTPAMSHVDPFSSATYSAPDYYSSPTTTAAMPLLLPSLHAQQQCSVAAGMTGFAWDRYPDFALSYGTTM